MKKILLSTALVLFAGTALVLGGTGAFFSDTETSTGNTFTAGAIDLKIDNSSYYNGVATSTTSWSLTDLTIEKFFNFFDLKPGDYGEDTISLHVDTNDSYLCANVTLTSNNDNGINEPEGVDGDVTGGDGQGELAQNVNFMWWADDGDNVLEFGERIISMGPIGDLTLNQAYPVTLADSDENIWTGVGGPVAGEETKYIGKAWCFGDIEEAPLSQSSLPENARATTTPAGDGNGNTVAGEPADGGYLCDGSGLDNITQTDSLTADVSFSAIQSRHNTTFQCEEPRVPGATLTLQKVVINDNLGQALDTAFTLSADGPTDISGLEGSLAVTSAVVAPGAYTLSETGGPIGYSASVYSCVVNGGPAVEGNNLVLADGDTAVCTITNDDTAPLACSAGQEWADSVVLGDQGRTKVGNLVLVDRRNPATALGVAQTTGTPTDAVVTPNSFYALGFGVATTASRTLVVSYDNNIIVNGAGNDIRVYEVTGGSYPDEHVKIEVSQDGINWFVALADGVRDAEADLTTAGLAWAKYVRLTDINVVGPFPNDADGFDVDAVRALNCGVVSPQV